MLPGSHRAAGTAGNCRVLRGGSFINNEDNARCAIRNRNNPDNRNRNNGVRVGVAAAHSSHEPAARRKCRPATALSRAEGLDDRGIERKRGLSLAAVAGLRARRLGRIQNSPGPWAADASLGRGASFQCRQCPQCFSDSMGGVSESLKH